MPGETEGRHMSGYQVRWAPEMLFPKLFLNTLSVLGLLRALGISILHQLGLLGLIDPCDPTRIPDILSLTLRRQTSITSGANLLLRQRLPVMKFAETVTEAAGEENSCCCCSCSCSVCLCEFEDEEEVRWLVGSCKHMFHKECLDKWIDHGRRTCPLCRAAFLSGYELEEEEEEEEEEEAVAEVFDGRWLCATAPDFQDW